MAAEDLKKYQFTSEQSRTKAAENGKKGGKASGRAKRRKKDAQAVARAILDEIVKTTDGSEVSVRYAMLRSGAQKAIKGDIKAITMLLQLANELPKQQAEVTIKTDKYDNMTEEELQQERERINNSINNL